MKHQRGGRFALLLVVATTLWGASSAVLAEVGKAAGTGAALLAAGGGAALILVALAGPAHRQGSRARPVLHLRGSFLLIGLLEALNLGLYAAALALGPVPAVVALHLTSPVLLVALSVLRGRRRADGLLVLQTLLMVGGIVLLGMQHTARAGSAPLLAAVLAVGSAVAVAALITAVATLAPSANPDVAAAAQLTIAALAIGPVMLVAAPPDQHDAAVLLVAGALFLGPGFAIYWRALRGLSAATAGVLGLNEAVAATIIGIVVFADTPSPASVLAGTLVLAAIVLELFTGRMRTQAGATRVGNKLE